MVAVNLDALLQDWMAAGLLGAVAAVVVLLFLCSAVETLQALHFLRTPERRPREVLP